MFNENYRYHLRCYVTILAHPPKYYIYFYFNFNLITFIYVFWLITGVSS